MTPSTRPMTIWAVTLRDMTPRSRDPARSDRVAVSRRARATLVGPALRHELTDGRDNLILRGGGELAVYRNRQRFRSRAFRVREVSAPVAQPGEAWLKVERYRVVDLVADAPFVEMSLQRVAPRVPDDELVEDVPSTGRLDR